jgi:RNA 2',3'-cyclic 3'-phosphodiesterase
MLFRLFIAIPLPETVKDEIERARRELMPGISGGAVRWTKREQFHLTLKFLGDVPETNVAALVDAVRTAGRKFGPLDLQAKGIGFFPGIHRPRVVWIGLTDAAGELPLLQAGIEAAVEPFTEEKPEGKFIGHVTLGRVRGMGRQESDLLKEAALAMAERSFGRWRADAVEIIRSQLSSSGSTYSVLARIATGAASA